MVTNALDVKQFHASLHNVNRSWEWDGDGVVDVELVGCLFVRVASMSVMCVM